MRVLFLLLYQLADGGVIAVDCLYDLYASFKKKESVKRNLLKSNWEREKNVLFQVINDKVKCVLQYTYFWRFSCNDFALNMWGDISYNRTMNSKSNELLKYLIAIYLCTCSRSWLLYWYNSVAGALKFWLDGLLATGLSKV